MTEVLVII